jgi:hypothetical protein
VAQLVSAGELSQRTAALKRFRELLQTQRDRFRQYLAALDREQDVIARGDAEALLAYVEIEEHIVTDISNIQKVIDPLERLYSELAASDNTAGPDVQAWEKAELGGLKTAVEQLRKEAAANAARNRSLLSGRMAEIRSEIKSLRGNPYAARRSVYGGGAEPLMIDIEG